MARRKQDEALPVCRRCNKPIGPADARVILQGSVMHYPCHQEHTALVEEWWQGYERAKAEQERKEAGHAVHQ